MDKSSRSYLMLCRVRGRSRQYEIVRPIESGRPARREPNLPSSDTDDDGPGFIECLEPVSGTRETTNDSDETEPAETSATMEAHDIMEPPETDTIMEDHEMEPAKTDAIMENHEMEPAKTDAIMENHEMEPAKTDAIMEVHDIELAETGAIIENHEMEPAKTDAIMEDHEMEPAKTDAIMENHEMAPAKTDAIMENYEIEPAKTDAIMENYEMEPAKTDAIMEVHDMEPAETGAIMEGHEMEPPETDAIMENNEMEAAKTDAIMENHRTEHIRTPAITEVHGMESVETDAIKEVNAMEPVETYANMENLVIEPGQVVDSIYPDVTSDFVILQNMQFGQQPDYYDEFLDFSSDDLAADPTYVPEQEPSLKSSINLEKKPVDIPKSPLSSPVKRTKKMLKLKRTRETAKKLRNEGKDYTSLATGKLVKGKSMGPTCTEKCTFKCATKITTEDRNTLFHRYWDLGDLEAQRNFLVQSLEKIAPNTRFTNKAKPRKYNNAFYFILAGKKERVCKLFFMNTLGISDRPIRTVLEKMDENGFLEPDKRGKHKNHKEVDPRVKQSVKDFINAIPRVESHYLRAQTTREYIDGGRSLADIHRDYVKEQQEKGETEFANLGMFSKIFNSCYNISFFIPKKDQCNLCEMHKNSPEVNDIAMKFEEHQYQKVLSRISKELDKDMGKKDNMQIVCCFDLQAVMPAPVGNASLFYYKSKVNSYNFTISNIVTGETTCFFWHEGEGKRGANEIASCIYIYLKELSSAVDSDELEVTFYSDNCCGQNKNRFIMAMFVFAQTTLKLKAINHKFLICGHTQNEGDVAHSLIERQVKKALKSGAVYIPQQYVPIIRNAKKNGIPFQVKELSHCDFYDFKKVQQQVGANFEVIENKGRIKISEIKMTRFESRDYYLVTTSYEEELKKVVFNLRKTKTKPALTLTPAYKNRLQVDERKKKDISDLILQGAIPRAYEPMWRAILH